MIVARLPLRTLIPLLIVAMLLLGQSLSFFVSMNQVRAQLLTNLEDNLNIVGTMTASRLETALRAGRLSQAKRALEQVMVDPNVRAALVFDAGDRVLLAASFPYLGRQLTQTPFAEAASLFQGARADGERKLGRSRDESKLFAIYPITLSPDPGQVIGDRAGLLTLLADTGTIDHTALRRAWKGFVSTLAISLAVTLLLWLLLNRYLLDRVAALHKATDAIAEGNYDVAMRLAGRDELAVIGANLERMRRRLLEQSEKLRGSEERYRSFVQTSSEGIYFLECDPAVPVFWPEQRQVAAILKHATLRTCNRIFAELRGEESPDSLLGASAMHAFGNGTTEDVSALLGDWVRAGYKLSGVTTTTTDTRGHTRVIICSLVGIVRDEKLIGIWGADRDETKRASLEQRNRAILSGSRDGFLVLDLDGNVLEVNDAYCRLTGYDKATLTSLRYQDLVVGQTDVGEFDLETVLGGGSALFETRHVAADGSVLELEVSANYLDHRAGRIFTFVRDIGESNSARRQLESYAARLREMSHQLLKLQESERRHIARELHDEVGQQLTALSINLQIAEAASSGGDTTLLRESRKIAATVMAQIRDMALNLRPTMLDDLGLAAALRWLAGRQASRGGMDLVLEIDPQLGRYASDLETTAYRIGQEAMTNILTHSGASRMTLYIRELANELYIEVSDDGAGFDTRDKTGSQDGTSFGLDGLRERVALCNGRFEIETAPGAGTTVRAWLPLEQADGATATQKDDRGEVH